MSLPVDFLELGIEPRGVVPRRKDKYPEKMKNLRSPSKVNKFHARS